MSNYYRKYVGIFLIGLTIINMTACNDAKSQSEVNENPKAAMAVNVVSPKMERWTDKVVASGNIRPWQEVRIGSEVIGVRITEVLVSVGDKVSKGQLLARLDDSAMRLELRLQQAMLTEAEVNQAQADLSLARAQRLDAARAISRQELLQYETTAKASVAKVAIAQAQIASLQLRISNTQIIAPDAGIISASNASVGAISDNATELFKLIRQGRVEWLAELRPEQQAKIEVGSSVTMKDPTGQLLRGRVRQVAPTADMDSRFSLVYVDVEGSKVVKPGVLIVGEFEIAKREALTIPQSAVVLRDGFAYALKVGDNNRIQQIKLSLGQRQQSLVEVHSGLTLSDRIVISGTAFLHENDLVRVVPLAPIVSSR